MSKNKIILIFITLHLHLSLLCSAAPTLPVELWPKEDVEQASLTFYQAEKANGMSVVVCPGGGYGGLAIQPEGHGIAQWLNQHGISAAVLAYRMPNGRHSLPLQDAQNAIAHLRRQSAALKLNPHQVGIIGFSAGGHLAASTVTLLKAEARPNFGIFIYPVINFDKHTHKGSRKNLLGALADDLNWQHYYSLEKHIDDQLPPVFLAHAIDDKVVVIENSQMFFDEAIKVQPKSKFIRLEQGGHGLNHYAGPSWDLWQTEALLWLKHL